MAPKKTCNKTTNGSDPEPDDSNIVDKNHVDPPACPPGSSCHVVVQFLKDKVSRLQRNERKRKEEYQTAFHHKDMNFEKKDAAFNMLKASIESREKTKDAEKAAAVCQAQAKADRELGRHKAKYVSLVLTSDMKKQKPAPQDIISIASSNKENANLRDDVEELPEIIFGSAPPVLGMHITCHQGSEDDEDVDTVYDEDDDKSKELLKSSQSSLSSKTLLNDD